MYSVTISEMFACPYGTKTHRGMHTRSVKKAFELAKKSKPIYNGDFSGVPILLEVTIVKNGKIIFREYS